MASSVVNAPAFASAIGSPSVTVAPMVNVNVEGGSRGLEANQELDKTNAKQVEGVVRSLVDLSFARSPDPATLWRRADMALSTFTPPVAPSPGTGFKRELKILAAEFGDGYTQPTPDGINHIRKTLTLKWDSLTEAHMKAIGDFLSDHAGTQPFYYRPAGHAAPLKWTCAEWEPSVDGVWRLTATFVESFSGAT